MASAKTANDAPPQTPSGLAGTLSGAALAAKNSSPYRDGRVKFRLTSALRLINQITFNSYNRSFLLRNQTAATDFRPPQPMTFVRIENALRYFHGIKEIGIGLLPFVDFALYGLTFFQS